MLPSSGMQPGSGVWGYGSGMGPGSQDGYDSRKKHGSGMGRGSGMQPGSGVWGNGSGMGLGSQEGYGSGMVHGGGSLGDRAASIGMGHGVGSLSNGMVSSRMGPGGEAGYREMGPYSGYAGMKPEIGIGSWGAEI